ncbi:MAG: hypothetical protein AAGA03_14855, partial [Planctomycetota bacterium]
VSLLGYLLAAGLLLILVGWLGGAIAATGERFLLNFATVPGSTSFAITEANPTPALKAPAIALAIQGISKAPDIMVLTLFWGLIGASYLLLRKDAGGQEPEDLWQPSGDTSPDLPSLPAS